MELTVKLKQHTPIIHFQWEQEGATLRATELKPKLDRYIKEKYYKGNNSMRLKYQVRIKYLTPLTKNGKDKILHKDSMFFGNLNQPEHKKKWEICGSELELRFNTYFNETLKKQIEETLTICLALENFGTRNNKGNGCFFIKDKTIADFEAVLKQNAPSSVYYWDCNSSDAFFSIKTVYSLLKSGINLSIRSDKTYYKSLLFKYFKDQNITWDKKAVKMKFLPTVRSDGWHSNNQKFVRGLLGVSDVQSWHTYNKTLTIKNNAFERVPSPLVFKVFDKGNGEGRIYFFARDFYSHLFGKTFKFTMSGCNGSLDLDIPMNFDMNKYLEYAVNEINTLNINNNGIVTTGLVKRVDEILTKVKSSQIKEL